MQQYIQEFLPSSFANTWSLNNERRAEEFHMNLRNNENIDVRTYRCCAKIKC